jgi:hypothetical protein
MPQDHPKIFPRPPQDAPRPFQDRPKTAQDRPNRAQEMFKTSQDDHVYSKHRFCKNHGKKKLEEHLRF